MHAPPDDELKHSVHSARALAGHTRLLGSGARARRRAVLAAWAVVTLAATALLQHRYTHAAAARLLLASGGDRPGLRAVGQGPGQSAAATAPLAGADRRLDFGFWLDYASADARGHGVQVTARCDDKLGIGFLEGWARGRGVLCKGASRQLSGASRVECYAYPVSNGGLACVSTNLVLDARGFMGPQGPLGHPAHDAYLPRGGPGSVQLGCKLDAHAERAQRISSGLDGEQLPWFQAPASVLYEQGQEGGGLHLAEAMPVSEAEQQRWAAAEEAGRDAAATADASTATLTGAAANALAASRTAAPATSASTRLLFKETRSGQGGEGARAQRDQRPEQPQSPVVEVDADDIEAQCGDGAPDAVPHTVMFVSRLDTTNPYHFTQSLVQAFLSLAVVAAAEGQAAFAQGLQVWCERRTTGEQGRGVQGGKGRCRGGKMDGQPQFESGATWHTCVGFGRGQLLHAVQQAAVFLPFDFPRVTSCTASRAAASPPPS
jgi:hypothetical protein